MEFAINILEVKFKNLKKMTKHDLYSQALKYLIITTVVLMILIGAKSITGIYIPIHIVSAENNDLNFNAGDALILTSYERDEIKVNDVIVFNYVDIPTAHRIIGMYEIHGKLKLFTKGKFWLDTDHVVGKVMGHVPYVGMATKLIKDYIQELIWVVIFSSFASKSYK